MLEDKLASFRTQQQREEQESEKKKRRQNASRSLAESFKSSSLYQLVFGTVTKQQQPTNEVKPRPHCILKSKNDLKKEKLEEIQNRLKAATASTPHVTQEDDENDEKEEETIVETRNYLNIFLKFLLWLVLYMIFIKLEFALVYIIVSIIVLAYLNTSSSSRKSNTLSAYSVFNPNLERIDGTLTSEQLEKSLIKMF